MAIPRTLADVSAPWLSSLLPHAVILGVSASPIGPGRGMTGIVGHLTVETESGAADYAIKLPASDQWERALREIRLLEAVELPLHTARLVTSDVDPSTGTTALLLEWIDGLPGDVAVGTTADRLGGLVDDLAQLHGGFRSPEALEKLEWLPRWGAGTADSSRPHRRRVERYRARVGPFLDAFGASAPPWTAGLLERIGRDFERSLLVVANLPPTLIHADAHLDNVIFGRKCATWLDWQSASRGPGMYDLVRLLSETLDVTTDLPLARRLVHRYEGHLTSHDVDAEAVRTEIGVLPEMASVVLAGFVSGYGGEGRLHLSPRERAVVTKAVSPKGLFGFVNHFVNAA